MSVKKLIFVLLYSSLCFAGLNADAVISIDMDVSGEGLQKSYTANTEGENFKVAVRVSDCNSEGNLNFFTVRIKIDTSKFTYVSSSFHNGDEKNILSESLSSPGDIGTDSSIEIGAALLGGTTSATSGLLGVFEFKSKLPIKESAAIIIENVQLCTPGPECDDFSTPDTGYYNVDDKINVHQLVRTIAGKENRVWVSGQKDLNFYVSQSGFVNITIADLQGRSVMTPLSGVFSSGEHRIKNGLQMLPGGTYICSISSGINDIRRCKNIIR
ncbi:MAG: hypothetical protein GX639_02785 [Fibrobacter sp.]|nr:hypothetical protein [Fibrobacter sp.]